MGRPMRTVQCAGTLVVVAVCCLAPAHTAHGAQVTIPLVDLQVDVDLDLAPPPPVTAVPVTETPQPAPAAQPTVQLVDAAPAAVSTEPVRAPVADPVPVGALGATSDAQPSPSATRLDTPTPMPRAPRTPLDDVEAATDHAAFPTPSLNAGQRWNVAAAKPTRVAHEHVRAIVANLSVDDLDADSTAVTSPLSAAAEMSLEPAHAFATRSIGSSAPAGIVPHVDAPPTRFASRVEDEFDHPWCSYHDVLRIERPG